MKHDRKQRALAKEIRPRQLALETLEARQVLDGTMPWHNDVHALDVDQSDLVTPHDAQVIVNRLILTGIGPLDPPSEPPEFLYDTTGDNMLSPADLARVINRLLTPPNIVLDTLMPYTIDLTPRLTVTTSSSGGVPDGTPVHLDVDLNNDGFYTGGEADYMVLPIYQNRLEFALDPGLPENGPSGPYSIKMQARLVDGDGVPGTSVAQTMVVDTQTSDALANYVNAPDPSYSWEEVIEPTLGPGGAYLYAALSMTSQTWREGDVNDPVWDHYLKVVIPVVQDLSEIPDTVLLYVSGGHNDSSVPDSPSDEMLAFSLATKAISVELRVVPNEPVYFFDETPITYRSEDEIIAYTLDQFMTHIGEQGNETWPLLLPMVKSAVRAMDTTQTYIDQITGNQLHINDFVVTGFSKRGWTTWLTAAVDDRVTAIMPGVFDNPNQGPQMVHHYEVYGFFSEAVEDYTNLQIFDRFKTPEAQELSKIIDPYRYFRNGKFDDMPVLSLDSAGDEFFVSDSSQFYFEDLPGPTNRLRYFPNTGHGLDETAVLSVAAFFDAVVNENPIPNVTWTIDTAGTIHAHTDGLPSQVLLWQATNPVARDFRWGDGYGPGGGPIGPPWSSSPATALGGGNYVASLPTPETGATAFLIEFTFPSGVPGAPHVFTTDIRVNSNLPLYAWPFPASSAPNVSVSDEPGSMITPTTVTTSDSGEPDLTLFVLPGIPEVRSVRPDPNNILTDGPDNGSTGVAVPAALADSAAYSDASDDVDLSGSGGEDAVDAVLDEYLDEVFS